MSPGLFDSQEEIPLPVIRTASGNYDLFYLDFKEKCFQENNKIVQVLLLSKILLCLLLLLPLSHLLSFFVVVVAVAVVTVDVEENNGTFDVVNVVDIDAGNSLGMTTNVVIVIAPATTNNINKPCIRRTSLTETQKQISKFAPARS